jgi:hypothetical protein
MASNEAYKLANDGHDMRATLTEPARPQTSKRHAGPETLARMLLLQLHRVKRLDSNSEHLLED